MVWKQPRPETPETARSESSRDRETQKPHGLKAAKNKNPETAWSESSQDPEFTALRNLKLKLKLKLKQRVKVKKFGEEIQSRAHAEKLELKSKIENKSFWV